MFKGLLLACMLTLTTTSFAQEGALPCHCHKARSFKMVWFNGRHLKDVTPQVSAFLEEKKFTEHNKVQIEVMGEKDTETWPGYNAVFVTYYE